MSDLQIITQDNNAGPGNMRGHAQFKAWLPMLLVMLNYIRTKELIPELATPSPAEKIERAIRLFKHLLAEEKDDEKKSWRQWSLEYFQACGQGAKSRREFLIEEGVFAEGKFLKCPRNVKPQMEICNLNPFSYSGLLQKEARELTIFMFSEYVGVKNLLSFPEFADIQATLSFKIPWLKFLSIPKPRLKLSLLLKNYVRQILAEAQIINGPPLICVFGPGKGEEIVPLIASGFSVLCLDIHDLTMLTDLFKSTFTDSMMPAPEIVNISEISNSDIICQPFKTWEERNYPPTVFLCSKINFSKAGTIPEELRKISRVSACIYVLHEMVDKESMFRNMAQVSRGSVVVFDGYPSVEAFDNIILSVSDRCGAVITGHDAVITHLLCLPVEEMEKIARKAVPNLNWRKMIVGPPIPAPFLHKLQTAVIGRSL